MKSKYLEYILLLVLFASLISRDVIISKYDYKRNINTSKTILIDNSIIDLNKLYSDIDLDNNDFNMEVARVVYRDVNSFYKYIMINKGTKHHLKEGDVVVNNNGFIGIIKKVSKYNSLVMLSTNPEMKLSVKINNSYGTLCNIDGKLVIKDLIINDEYKYGDLIYTSGLTSIPGNFVVGSIQKIEKDESKLSQIIFVNSNIDSELRYVTIIKDNL